MGFRFRRSLRLPGVRLNIGKRGVSTSIGGRGAQLTLDHGQVRETVGMPGSGLSYTHVDWPHKTAAGATRSGAGAGRQEPSPKERAWRGWRWILLVAAIIGGFLIAGCANTGVVPANGNTYIVSDRGPTVGFSQPIRQTANVFKQANTFCGQQNKQVEQVKLDQQDSGLARPASATLQFRGVAGLSQ